MCKRHEITAIIYDKKGNVLSIGKNDYHRSHTMQALHAKAVGLHQKIFLHAEIDAIVKCRHLDKAHRILVTRFNAKGEPMLAKPCPICQRAISFTSIKKIDFTV
jgi:deoxycytidylate deaminase